MSQKKSVSNSGTTQRLDSSTDRVLGILDLFTEQQPVWTTAVLIERLGVARATMYRYLRALVETGFLVSDGDGSYSLGPRFIEMDRQIRLADPLLQVAPQVMQALRPQFTGDLLLSRFYGQKVLVILEDRVDPRIKVNTTFDRGRPFGIFLGAPSRIILANLTQQQLQRIFLNHSEEIASAKLGNNWLEFRQNMQEICKRGFAIGSDIDKNLVGVSAPIFLPTGEVTGSLCLVKMRKEASEQDLETMGELAKQAGAEISKQLSHRLTAASENETLHTKKFEAETKPRKRPGRPSKASAAVK